MTDGIINASDKCPYGECDGNGFVLERKEGDIVSYKCKCYEQVKLNNRMQYANIPDEFNGLTFDNFSLDYYPQDRKKSEIALKSAKNFVEQFETFEEEGKGLYFHSKTYGSGKTLLSVMIANELLNRGVAIRYIKTVNLLAEIKKTWDRDSNDTESSIISGISNTRFLILDDIGVEAQKDWSDDIFYRILDNRMERKKVTIFTSNIDQNGLKLNPRTVSRIKRMTIPIYLPEVSVRDILSRQENMKFAERLLR